MNIDDRLRPVRAEYAKNVTRADVVDMRSTRDESEKTSASCATHRIIKPGDTVLDVGAAPGSWTLYTHRELLKGRGRIVSCDLNPLSLDPVPPTVTEITGDAFSKEIRARLTELGPYDAIISDAAPMTTGNRTVDTTRSEGLASEVVRLAEEQLKKGGNLVIKMPITFYQNAEVILLCL